MEPSNIQLSSEHYAEIDAFLDKRLYEFNCQTTGVTDGELFAGSIKDQSENVIAAINGHTWGGCCEVVHLWVHESHRSRGLGRALLNAAESEARRRGCSQVVLSTHSFQAPVFYERLGYRRLATVADYPKGHAKLFYVKQLERDDGV